MSSQITLVGPVHPYRGGIASHTARLATELEKLGGQVVVESWSSQYPRFLRAGSRADSGENPEIRQPRHVRERLTWYNPISWYLAGRRSRGSSLWVSYVSPYQVPSYLVMRWAHGSSPCGAILHNVLPHERGKLDRFLLRLLTKSFDRYICHDSNGASELMTLGVFDSKVVVMGLPAALTVTPVSRSLADFRREGPPKRGRRLLFFGFVRNYKGLDILLEALAKTFSVELWIAGDFWEPKQKFESQILELGIQDRVQIFDGYISKDELPNLFACCDALVLPYRSGTGSALTQLGHSQGLPVIASDVGAVANGIRDGVDGFIVKAEDTEHLADAINRLGELGLATLRRTGPERANAQNDEAWRSYALAVAKS